MFPDVIPNESIASLADDIISRYPSHIAVDYESRLHLTYSQLGERASRLAYQLSAEEGIQKGDLVPVVLTRCFAQVVAIIALARIGAVYVPIDPEIPKARTEHLIHRISPKSIITTEKVVESYGLGNIIPKYLNAAPYNSASEELESSEDSFSEGGVQLAPEASSLPAGGAGATSDFPHPHPDDLAAVLFTSGSTGTPKGVKLSHRNLIEPARFLARHENITASSAVFQFSSSAFDVHLIDITCTIFTGARLCQVSKDNMLSDVGYWINLTGSDVVHLTPSVISTLVPENVPTLKYMVTCGEPVTPTIIRTWSEKVLLTNLYGPCEASSVVSIALKPDSAPAVVGTANHHATIAIVDPETKTRQPNGEAGEIYVTGESVAMGYLGDEKTTAEKFFDVFGDGRIFYSTGDFGCITPDGGLRLLGRQDSQVKINGQRVEFSEIERCVAPHVGLYVIRAIKDAKDNQQLRLYAFVTVSRTWCGPEDEVAFSENYELMKSIDSACRSSLPSYMTPRVFVVEAMPRNLSGKIDAKRLESVLLEHLAQSKHPWPDKREGSKGDGGRSDSSNRSASDEGDGDNVAQRVASIVCNIIQGGGAPRVDDDLFLWGLTSLDTMMMIKDLDKVFHVLLSVREIMSARTIRGIVALILEKVAEDETDSDSAGSPGSSSGVHTPYTQSSSYLPSPGLGSSGRFLSVHTPMTSLSLSRKSSMGNLKLNVPSLPTPSNLNSDGSFFVQTSPAQNRIYAATKLGHNYNCSFVMKVKLDFLRFTSAMQVICSRHEVLRSTYHEDEQEMAKQKVHPAASLKPVIREDSAYEKFDHALNNIKEESKADFDLEVDSPLRATYYSSPGLLHICIHHIAIDEWSFDCLLRELELVYHQQSKAPKHRTNGIHNLFLQSLGAVRQYSEFATLQTCRSPDEQMTNLDWWAKTILREHTESIIPRITMLKIPQESAPFEECGLHVHKLPAGAVRHFGTEVCQNTTPFISWLSLTQVVLARISSQRSFILNIPVTDRANMPQFYETIGFFLNTVAFPVAVNNASTFFDIRKAVQDHYLDILAHPAPYEDVARRLRSLGGEASMELNSELMFVFHDKRKPAAVSVSSPYPRFLQEARRIDLPSAGARVDLVIHFDENGEVPALKFEYKSSLFPKQFIECLGRSFETMLLDIVADTEAKSISDLRIISAADENKLETYSTMTEIPQQMQDLWINGNGDALLHDFVVKVADEYFDEVALESLNGEKMTYEVLMHRARSLASSLRASYGIGSTVGDVVALMMDKSLTLVVCQLATLIAGAAFVNVDPSHKAAVNENKIEVCKAKLVIVEDKTSQPVSALKKRNAIVNIADFLDLAGLPPTYLDLERPKASDLAYLCFTSGSTGQPKLIPIHHGAAAAGIASLVHAYGMGPGDRRGMLCSITFDISVLEVYLTLACGSTLCIPPTDDAVTSVADVINKMQITHISLTPTVLSSIQGGPREVPSLRSVCLGGEPTPRKLFNIWGREPGLSLFNVYGPSETLLETHRRQFFLEDDDQAISQKIGRPYPSLRSYVLDSFGKPVLPGCVGMLHISERVPGRWGQVSRGYLTELAAGKENPFFQHDRFGWTYCTGDLAFYDFKGDFYIQGRQDDQVKLHGVRFDLGDIEGALSSLANGTTRHGGVEVVVTLSALGDEKHLTAFVKHDASGHSSENASQDYIMPVTSETMHILRKLREESRAVMHNVMVPQYWVPVCRYPLNVNGKTDRKALQARFAHITGKREYLLLDPKAEKGASDSEGNSQLAMINPKLLAMWSTMLKIDLSDIDIDQPFFNAGGDSISAILFCSKARAAGLKDCTVSQFYKTPTLAGLNALLSTKISQALVVSPPEEQRSPYRLCNVIGITDDQIDRCLTSHSIDISKVAQVYPVTAMQRSMLLQSMEDPRLYASQLVYRLSGVFDLRRFQAAAAAVHRAHPSLRTTFAQTQGQETSFGELLSVEMKASETGFSKLEVESKPEVDFESLLEADRVSGFPLGGSMLRLRVFCESTHVYYVAITAHHASIDGWSGDVIVRDLASAYAANSIENSPSFSSFVEFHQQSDRDGAIKFWHQRLHGFSPATTSTESGCAENEIRVLRHRISPRGKDFSKFAAELGITNATVFQAAASFVLSRMTGSNDNVFGMVVAGRNADIPGIERMVGNFLNTIPFRHILDGDFDVASWLKQVHEHSLECLRHDHLSLEEILQLAESHTSGERFFDVVLNYEFQAEESGGAIKFGPELVVDGIQGRENSEVPLTLVIEHVSDGTVITAKYDKSKYSEGAVSSALEQYARIVEDIVGDPHSAHSRKVSSVGSPLTYRELDAIKTSHTNLDRSNMTLVSAFRASVQRFPRNIAVHDAFSKWSFEEVDAKSDSVAAYLVENGVGKGKVVGILSEKSAALVIAMLGVLKTGAAYCPLDVNSPKERLELLIRKLGAKTVLGNDRCQKELPGFISIDDIPRAFFKSQRRILSDSPCYILFTSGTTGEPKGCVLSHRAVYNVVEETSALYGITPSSRVLLFANAVFDASVVDIYGALSRGATLCIPTQEELLTDLAMASRSYRADILHLTPSVASLLAPEDCPTVKTLVLGGEKVSAALRDRWAAKVRLIDGYGPTECAVQVSATVIHPYMETSVISQPLKGNLLVLLDNFGNVARVGQVGEIHVGGTQLFDGYLGASELTDKVLVPAPFNKSVKLYATGDLGRYREGMHIEIVGRKDTQVKLAGQRVEVEEIESILVSLPNVRRAAVFVDGQILHARVEGDEAGREAIEAHCARMLPPQLVPTISFVAAIPMTASNKINRRQVKEDFEKSSDRRSQATKSPPATSEEIFVASAISKLVNGPVDDTNALLTSFGLNSIGMMQLRAILAKRYGTSMTYSQIRGAGTILRLAKKISRLSVAAPVASLSSILDRRVSRKSTKVMGTLYQMWLAQERLRDSSYNVCRVVELKNVYKPCEVSDALRQAIDHVDIFRSTFEWNHSENALQQVHHESPLFDLEVKQDYNEAAMKELCEQDSNFVFDLKSGPLARIKIFSNSGVNGAIFVYYNIHHILVDEWTCDALVDSLLRFLNGRDQQEFTTLSGETDDSNAVTQAWKAKLEDISPLDTTSWPTGTGTSRSVGEVVIEVPVGPAVAIQKFSKASGQSAFSIFLSVFQLLLHKYTSAEDLAVLIPLTTRGNQPETHNTLGNFTNTAVIRSNIVGINTTAEFIQKTGEFVDFAMDNSRAPLDQVLKSVGASLQEHSVMFSFNNGQDHSEVIDRSSEFLRPLSAMFDITFNVVASAGSQFSVALHYDQSKFDGEFMQLLVDEYVSLASKGYQSTIQSFMDSGIDLRTGSFLKSLPEPTILHQLFERQAKKNPHSIAIDYYYEGKHELVTYEELDRKADKLANALIELGVGRDDIVPIFAEQSPDLVISFLGILKAGAAYTPLARDGVWPEERMTRIIQRVKAKVIVADCADVPGAPAGVQVVPVVSDGGRLDTAPRVSISPSDIAYILWTSGTTGEPKGVKISHASAATALSNTTHEVYERGAEDRVLNFSSPIYDVVAEDVFCTLSVGATVCMAPRRDLLDRLEHVMIALKPTMLDLTPSVASLLDPSVTPLKVLSVGGEAITEKVMKIWGKSTRLVNVYGPCENTVSSTFRVVKLDDGMDKRSIGKPLSTVRVAILDRWNNISPPYVPGEICLGGNQMFSGYLNDDVKTAEVHIDHPSAGRLYRSGDFGFQDSDGNIIFLGRRDHQVKIRGQRTELGGISSIIEESPNVTSATVMLASQQLIAFVVFDRRSEDGRLERVKEWSRSKLPARTVPSVWLEVDRIPITASGKVNQRELLAIYKDKSRHSKQQETAKLEVAKQASASETCPANDIERMLITIFRSILPNDGQSIEIETNLFEAGLDSFSGMAAVAKLRKEVEVDLSLNDILDCQCLSELAVAIKQLKGIPNRDEKNQAIAPPVSATAATSTSYPASSIQKRFYFAQRVLNDATYNIPLLIEVKAGASTIVKAINDICQQNSIFRTRFELRGDEVFQIVHPDITGASYAEIVEVASESDVRSACDADSKASFDLERLPLIRAKIFPFFGRCILYINMHHIITDEASNGLFIRDVIHRATAAGPTPLYANFSQYLDYSTEEQNQNLESSLDYWKSSLVAVSPLAIIGQGKGKRTLGAFEHSFSTAGRPKWAARKGATPFSYHFGLFQAVLQRLWNFNDSAILIPASQRPHGENVYGCFINTVPVVAGSIDNATSLAEIVRASRKNVFDALGNASVPFERIAREAGFGADDFQVMFVYHEDHQQSTAQEQWKPLNHLLSGNGNVAAKFPLTVSLTVSNNAAKVAVEFDSSIVSGLDVEILCVHYERLLNLAVENQNATAPLGQLNILTAEEQSTVEVLRKSQAIQADNEPLVHELIQQRAEKMPDSTACIFENTEKCTYEELWSRVEAIKAILPERRSNDTVGIYLDAGIERIAAILGTVSAGFAYVPLDVNNPASRNAFIIQDCCPKAIIARRSKAIEKLLAEISAPVDVLYLGELGKSESSREELQPVDIQQSDLAYILYTSGSTGTPKGVEVTHDALSNSIREHRRIYGLEASSRLLQFAPWTFDVSVADIFGTLSAGGTLCLGRKNYLLTNLAEAIRTMSVTHIATTPTVISLLTPETAPSLRMLAIGGEPMTKQVRDTWTNSKATLRNVYGPTEATVNIVSKVMTATTPIAEIGRPLMNVVAYILNEQLSEMPFGCVGQLAISGPQLARGYRNRLKENEQAFIQHEEFGRLYLTGDLAKMDRDGSITCFGRIDTQVKLRGQRIELGEIEETLVAAGAKRAVALLVKDDQTQSLAVAFTEGEAAALKSAAKKNLPSYFFPKYWIPMNIPLNNNGKVDRKEVAKQVSSLDLSNFLNEDDSAALSTSSFVPLSGEKETLIGGLVKTLLNVRGEIFANNNFFSLSGDSISAVRLVTMARSQGLNFTVVDIYNNPTISQLASVATFTSESVRTLPTEIVSKSHGFIEPTPIMEWFQRSNKRNPHWYNQSQLLKFSSLEMLNKMPAAWEAVVAAHPSLRIRSDGSRVWVPEHSVNDFKTFERKVSQAAPSAAVQSCLNLKQGPISCLDLMQASDGHYYSFIVVHHLAIDIVSWRIIFDDLRQFLMTGEELEPEYGSFRDWSERVQMRQSLMTIEPPTEDASLGKQESNTVSSREVIDITLGSEETSYLLSKANTTYKTEPVDLILSGLVIAYSEWNKAKDNEVEICFESHGRDFHDETVDVSRTVGWFTHFMNMKFANASSTPVADVICHVKDVRNSHKEKHDVARPLPACAPIVFNYSGASSGQEQNDGIFEVIHMTEEPGDEDPNNLCSSVFDVGVGVSADGSMSFSILFSSAMYEAAEISSLLQMWKDAMMKVLKATDTTAVSLTPSDVPHIKANSTQLSQLLASIESYGIPTEAIEDIVPATDMQSFMFLKSQETGSYLESFTYEIEGQIDTAKFAKAWETVLQRHSVLRTVFVPCEHSSEFELLQVVLKPENYKAKFSFAPPPAKEDDVIFGKSLCSFYLHDGNRFTWRHHHALTDGWSTGIIMSDLKAAYLGQSIPASPQFKDVSVRLLQSNETAASFWKAELEGVEVTQLTDYSHKKSDKPTPQDSEMSRAIDCSVADLGAFASKHGTTISVLLRAAWGLTLSAYTGDSDVVFGVTCSGRNIQGIEDVESVVGPCINTVPFLVRGAKDTITLKEYLQKVKQTTISVLAHESYSLRKIYGHIGCKKELFNTVLLYQNYPKEKSSEDCPFSLQMVDAQESTDIPLNVMIGHTEDGKLHINAMLHGENFSTEFLENLLDSFGLALNALSRAGSENTTLDKLNILSDTHLSKINRLISGPSLERPTPTTYQLLLEQVEATPDNVALEFYGAKSVQELTYRELLQRVDIAAANMVLLGVQFKAIIAIYLEKSFEMVISVLALHRLGAAYLPIETGTPKERIDVLLRESSAKGVITSKEDASLFAGTPIIDVDNLSSPASTSSLPPHITTTEDLAAVLFTSGTTGVPKGVCMPHRQYAGYGVTMVEAYAYNSTSRIFNFARPVFDVWISDVFGALVCGATVCMAAQQDIISDLTGLLNRSRATDVNLTTSVASTLDPEELPYLKGLVLTGEAATRQMYEIWAPKVGVVNSYGPTEAVVITWTGVDLSFDPRCLGGVCRGMDIMILDDKLRKVPFGASGTIYTSGAQLSLGYLKRPDLTKKSFVNNRYRKGQLMYNTGDQAAYDSKGRIIYLGRKDHQVKLHGQRIELAEIENAVGGTVMLMQSPTGPALVAFVASEAKQGEPEIDTDVDEDAILERAKKLPKYMVPSTIVGLTFMPLTNNGKVNRAALKAAYDKLIASQSGHAKKVVEPKTDTERVLLKILSSMVSRSEISTDADLFTMLDSLSSMRFASQIRKTLNISVKIQWVIENPSIIKLARRIDQGEQTTNESLPSSSTPSNGFAANALMSLSEPRKKAFFIHPCSGLSFEFRRVAKLLTELEVIGINDPHFGEPDAYTSIHDMAALYCSIITEIQSSGPYSILGYSFGAHVAVEVARLLRSRSEDVNLVLVDSSARVVPMSYLKPESIKAVINRFGLGHAEAPSEEETDLRMKIGREVERNLRMMTEYSHTGNARSYDGPVTFLRAFDDEESEKKEKVGGEDVTNGYGKLMKKLKTLAIYGDHYDVFTDPKVMEHNVAVLKNALM